VDSVSYETVQGNRKIEYWVIPPKADAEFVAHIEEAGNLRKPYDPNGPVLCMDEQPVQLVKETRSDRGAAALATPCVQTGKLARPRCLRLCWGAGQFSPNSSSKFSDFSRWKRAASHFGPPR
jgi:hypothetical protein